jgi:hypothetical protein
VHSASGRGRQDRIGIAQHHRQTCTLTGCTTDIVRATCACKAAGQPQEEWNDSVVGAPRIRHWEQSRHWNASTTNNQRMTIIDHIGESWCISVSNYWCHWTTSSCVLIGQTLYLRLPQNRSAKPCQTDSSDRSPDGGVEKINKCRLCLVQMTNQPATRMYKQTAACASLLLALRDGRGAGHRFALLPCFENRLLLRLIRLGLKSIERLQSGDGRYVSLRSNVLRCEFVVQEECWRIADAGQRL